MDCDVTQTAYTPVMGGEYRVEAEAFREYEGRAGSFDDIVSRLSSE